MKYLIASDIHGSAYYCRALAAAFEREEADRLILLGDLLYHGPRNDLPREYAPREVIGILNGLAARTGILCVRGNCEAEVDQMVLDFPVTSDCALLEAQGHTVFLTHGHLWNAEKLPPLRPGDVLLCGHTHVPACEEREGFVYMNPGSVSIPKNGSHHGYMTLCGGEFWWRELGGEPRMRYTLK